MSTQRDPIRRASRACDACKRRKVRCDGLSRCQQCKRHDLHCAYPSQPALARRRSRLGAAERGTMIAECRARVRGAGLGDVPSPPMATVPYDDLDFFFGLLPDYMLRVYPITPIMGETEVRTHIQRMHTSNESAMLIYAFTGVVLGMSAPSKPLTHDETLDDLVARAMTYYKPMAGLSVPSIARIVTCLFLELLMFMMGRTPAAFFYLREAMTLLQILQVDIPLTSESLDPPERARRQRLYWQCFIHERYMALAWSYPICLNPLPDLPDVDPTVSSVVEQGWNHIIKTFILVDRDFVNFWTGDRSRVTTAWVQQKHDALTDEHWLLGVELLPTAQQADLIITRQWLRTLTWQLAISNFLMTSDAASSRALSLSMPIELSSQLRQSLEHMTPKDVEFYGWGSVEKLFEITNAIADVLMHLPRVKDPDETRRRIDDFLFVKNFLFALPAVHAIQRKMLEEKLDQIKLRYGADLESQTVELSFI